MSGGTSGNCGLAVHHIAHMRELGAKLAAGMKIVEIPCGESLVLEECDRQCIAKRHLQQG